MWHDPNSQNVQSKTCPACGKQQPAMTAVCECGYAFDPYTIVERLTGYQYIQHALSMIGKYPALWVYGFIIVAGSYSRSFVSSLIYRATAGIYAGAWVGYVLAPVIAIIVVAIQQFGQCAIIYALGCYERGRYIKVEQVLNAAWRLIPRVLLLGLIMYALSWAPSYIGTILEDRLLSSAMLVFERLPLSASSFDVFLRAASFGINLIISVILVITGGIAQQLCMHQQLGALKSLGAALQIAIIHNPQVLGIAVILYAARFVISSAMAIPYVYVVYYVLTGLLSMITVVTWTLFYLDLARLGFVASIKEDQYVR